MKLTRWLIFLVALFAGSFAHAENGSVTGLFSTFQINEKSGDISGAEIHIVPNPVGYSAIVQASEGAPGYPEVIALSVKDSKVEFAVPENSASGFMPGKYVGTVTNKGIVLRGPKGFYEELFLPRRNSLWQ